MDERRFDEVTRAIAGATTRRGALAGIAALVPLGAAAKTGRNDRPGHAGKPDAAKKRRKCKPSKCPAGCCSGKSCLSGVTEAACGTAGSACVACAPGEVCVGGACAPACGPATCGGCCDPATNACKPGSSAGACGAGGATCAACSGSASCCVAGACAEGTWANRTTFGMGPGSASGQFDTPQGVAVSADRLTVLVSDSLNARESMWRGSAADPASWSAETTFGSAGSLPNQFGFPQNVALAADGLTAWIADFTNRRVAVWVRPSAESTAWAVAATFGTAGSGLDQFEAPHGVAVSPDLRTVWVSDVVNNRISMWSRPGANSNAWTWQATFGSGPGSGPSSLAAPRSVAVSEDGLTVAVADAGNNRISVWARPDADSLVWSNRATFGTFGSGAGELNTPWGVALSPSGTQAWAVDTFNSRISRWTRPTATSAAWSYAGAFGGPGPGNGPDKFDTPVAIAVADDGRAAWIADTNNQRISVWAETCP